MADLRDNRGKTYRLNEAILSAVMMFLLREGSRNSYNRDREEPVFSRNIRRLLGIRLTHGDTFNDVLVRVDPEDLQRLKASLVRVLVARKVFHSHRRDGKHAVAVDATGTHSLDGDYSGSCLSRTSKNGVVSYSHAVLEAKLVAPNGFAVSLASVWLENNAEGHHDKQDCELAAFKRLSVRLKELYPRLPMLILADALYANAPVMEICRASGWDFMLVVKEGVLRDLGEEILLRPDRVRTARPGGSLSYLGDLEYAGYPLSWIGVEEAGGRFSWITNIPVADPVRAGELAMTGRLRWKIENEGFNTQKNLGYNLEHSYSRKDYNALKNYYQCLQIAHMVEQLTLLEKKVKKLTAGSVSILKIFERIRNMLVYTDIDPRPVEKLLGKKVQVRFD
ncbi:hypothetical protein ADIS_3894 [Lunatimonas lonarensis]|uniref:Transposase IS4-like domain-containing protein n=1 Tax=Lunatimonas lonarensis TaxID=1232681 RepID=R7ZNJ9_9BACT|nr:hypothetical protein [Lunatimonas lonarensis]EON75633.1 hypothetical protein ADIS_3894 [Lunatimonas lonarensis]